MTKVVSLSILNQRENSSIEAQKANMFKEKRLIEKEGTSKKKMLLSEHKNC